MPGFNGIVITESGQALLAKAQIGKNLNFTKIQLGSNNDVSSPETKTSVIAPFLTTAITELKITGDGKARISTYISNQSLEQSYVWREIGLFAKDPDTNEEKLYAYKCAGENGETLPAGGGADIIEKIFDIIINISNASNVTATIDGSTVYVKTRDIVQTLAECENQENKVPSAKLFYDNIADLLNTIYPINIVVNFKDVLDHSNFCGFNWERTNVGKFPVGYKSGDSKFGTVGGTGGSNTKTILKANLPNYTLYNAIHGHEITDPKHSHNVYSIDNGSEYFGGYVSRATNGSQKGTQWGQTDSQPTGISIKGTTIRVDSGGSGTVLDITPAYEVNAYWRRVS